MVERYRATPKPSLFDELKVGHVIVSKTGECVLEIRELVDARTVRAVIIKGGDGLRGLDGSAYYLLRSGFGRFGFKRRTQ